MSAGAFGGDPAVKSALLATIDRHVADGTLVFDGTTWDGTRGSPLGISIEGDDTARYAELYGFPLALAALLDPVTTGIDGRERAVRAVRDWAAAPAPGADLSAIPSRLVLRMLTTPEAQGVDDALAARLATLHDCDAAGMSAPRAEWSAVRQEILARSASPDDTMAAATLALWEACSWPASRGRSTVALAFAKWALLRARGSTGDWTDGDAARAQATLQALWDEQSVAREADETIDYPALFEARDPELAAGFTAHLERTNARFLASATLLADWCATLFAEAPVAHARAG